MFFSCSYLSHRDFKVYPKLPGDKFRAWELRYLNDCLLYTEQRHFDTFLTRWQDCFKAAGVQKLHDHILNTPHAAKLKRAYHQSDKAEANKKARLLAGLPLAECPNNSVCAQPSIPAQSSPGSRASSSQPQRPSSPLPATASQARPASCPATEPSTHILSAETTGLTHRAMTERCCSTLALLLMLQRTASASRGKKGKPAHDCIVTLLTHCFGTYSCQDLIHEACRLLPHNSCGELKDAKGDPAATNAHQFCQLVLRLHGPPLGALLTAAAVAMDDDILPRCKASNVGASCGSTGLCFLLVT